MMPALPSKPQPVNVLLALVCLCAGPAPCLVAAAADLGPAPDFNLRTLDGQVISRASLAGKIVVINFWATWCPDCMNAIPGYRALQEKLGSEADFVFLAVSLDESPPEEVKTFVDRHRLNYPVAMGDQALARAFGGVDEIPTTFVVDRTSTIRYKQAAALDYDQFEPLLRSLLDAKG